MTGSTPDMTYISYNHMHKLCQQAAVKLREADKIPDIIVAISGGGLIPARMLRTFLKKENGGKSFVSSRERWKAFVSFQRSNNFSSSRGKLNLSSDMVGVLRSENLKKMKCVGFFTSQK